MQAPIFLTVLKEIIMNFNKIVISLTTCLLNTKVEI